MKALGLIERVPGQRGTWRLTPRARQEGDLTQAPKGVAMIACSTDLGVAIWTRSETGFQASFHLEGWPCDHSVSAAPADTPIKSATAQ